MKKICYNLITLATFSLMISCQSGTQPAGENESAKEATPPAVGQSGVKDEVSNPNIVQIAVGSKDHTTLVAAVQAAELVDALSNAGPFTVFAPTNEAFNKLPAGTVEGLLKPEKKDDLADILQYHVFIGVLNADDLMKDRVLGQVNGGNVKVTVQDGKPLLNGKAHILASISIKRNYSCNRRSAFTWKLNSTLFFKEA